MLLRFLLLSYILLISSVSIDAQNCFGGNFTTQAGVDSFLVNNPTCTVINSGLRINSGSTDPITNLNAFANIARINGNLTILNSQITTLGPLENVDLSGSGHCYISGNPNLLSINLSGEYLNDGGSSLNIYAAPNAVINFNVSSNSNSTFWNLDIRSENGTIFGGNNNLIIHYIYFNTRKVIGFNGLNDTNTSLISIQADTIIGFNALENVPNLNFYGYLDVISGFASLNSGQISIQIDSPELPTLPVNMTSLPLTIRSSAVENLVNLSENTKNLTLYNNQRLKNLVGAEGLVNISNLEITNNDSLSSIQGIHNLLSIENSLIIKSNERLEDISALNSVKLIEGMISISDNLSLSSCCILATLRNRNRIGSITLSNNGPNCSSIYNVLEVSCVDSDLDGIFNTTDNCDHVANPNQLDSDSDGIGNLCDNCPGVSNSDQADADGNGIGDVCQSPLINNVTIKNGELFVKDDQLGLIIKSIDGLCYRIKVDGNGQVMATLITCPN